MMTRLATLLLMTFALATPALAADLPPALVDAYLRAQAALASDTLKDVPEAAKAIESGAAPLGTAAQPVIDGARKMGGAKTIDAARTAFGEMSTALVGYAEKNGSALPGDLHIAYCPMADKPWLQKGTEIKNPYYGAAMAACGSIKK